MSFVHPITIDKWIVVCGYINFKPLYVHGGCTSQFEETVIRGGWRRCFDEKVRRGGSAPQLCKATLRVTKKSLQRLV